MISYTRPGHSWRVEEENRSVNDIDRNHVRIFRLNKRIVVQTLNLSGKVQHDTVRPTPTNVLNRRKEGNSEREG